MSAVESTTRSSTSSSSSTPNSRSTPRGSETARERYGRLLYQSGGGPSSAFGIAGAQRAHDHVVHGVGVLQGDDDRRRPRVEAELESRLARVAEQPLLELGVDPCARDEPRAVGRCAGDEPVDPAPDVLVREDALLDQQLLEDACPRRRGGLVAVRDRVVVVVVVLVIVAHGASSQCPNTSTRTRSFVSLVSATR